MEGGENGSPVALDEDSVTGQAFIELARNVAHAVDETGETAKRVRVTKYWRKGLEKAPFQTLLYIAFIQITANVINSATATASQIPLTPNHNGRRKKQTITGNMSPLKTGKYRC